MTAERRRGHVWVMWVSQEDVPYIEVYGTKASAERAARTINRQAKADDDIDTFATVGKYYIRGEVVDTDKALAGLESGGKRVVIDGLASDVVADRLDVCPRCGRFASHDHPAHA